MQYFVQKKIAPAAGLQSSVRDTFGLKKFVYRVFQLIQFRKIF